MKSIDDVLDRIKKLLALSKSSNKHEAALAAARAADLMFEYQITEAQLEDVVEEPIGEHEVESGASRLTPWRLQLLQGVAFAFGCARIVQTVRNRVKHGLRWKVKDRSHTIKVVGRASDVSAVKYMYAYFVAEIERLAEIGWNTRGRGPGSHLSQLAYKNAFRFGAATLIRHRLEEERNAKMDAARANPELAHALIRIDARALAVQAHLEELGCGKQDPMDANVSDEAALLDGARAGATVDLGTDKNSLTAGAPRLPAKGSR